MKQHNHVLGIEMLMRGEALVHRLLRGQGTAMRPGRIRVFRYGRRQDDFEYESEEWG